ncbi:DUF1064 domain-containing protein [Geomicrobium sp. JCM 19037]|uniref:DUF1064 domain-containing protein n=1 Tax=Geomicrobium sp. JCM 19037 TaxID=1460634 RepID=UPI0027D771B3|nr:DUF1064 domain-containing protein [Geomicrobium sp. JCM 19037]
MAAEEYNKRQRKRRSKYHNKRVEVDGITFDSKREARYYQDLMLRKRLGYKRFCNAARVLVARWFP